eukprot:7219795-Lingulodinium_polyedra.AAC.1
MHAADMIPKGYKVTRLKVISRAFEGVLSHLNQSMWYFCAVSQAPCSPISTKHVSNNLILANQ